MIKTLIDMFNNLKSLLLFTFFEVLICKISLASADRSFFTAFKLDCDLNRFLRELSSVTALPGNEMGDLMLEL
jgi:hypothetical protein